MSFTLKVNGKSSTVDVPADMPLLWVLRDVLDLKGTKFGCGIAQCGACTVQVKGSPVRSCSVRVADAAGMDITTIEGLSPDGKHPLQIAWQELDVPQCGYCQAGQIMSATSAAARPTRASAPRSTRPRVTSLPSPCRHPPAQRTERTAPNRRPCDPPNR
jgi:isoquinoline 1-oxidoreductase subunit alpha